MAFFFSKSVRYLIFLAIFISAVQYYLRWKSYTINAKELKQISGKSAGQDALDAISRFTGDIRRRYPRSISNDLNWIPLSAGGLHLKAQFLYGDLTEYMAIFTAVGDTQGRSGMHWSNSSCTVLSGSVSRLSDATSSSVRETFDQGKIFRHGQFESYVYLLKDNTAVVCYGRGFIPVSSVWVLSGSIANGDPYSAAKLIYAYSRLFVDNLFHNVKDAGEYLKKKIPKMEL